MARAGRYCQKQNKPIKPIGILVLFLILFAALFSWYSKTQRSERDALRVTEPETVESVQVDEQTIATKEPLFQTEQPAESTELTNSPEIETTSHEEAATETVAEPSRESQSAKQIVHENIPEGYASVLQQYRELIMMDSHEFLELYGNESELDLQLSIESLEELADKGELATIAEILARPKLHDRYPFVHGETLRSAKMYNESCDITVYHYAYYNIDGKRADELLIGTYDEYYDDYSILAIYTDIFYAPGNIGIMSVSDNSRAHLTIFTDGTIGRDSSGGAAHHYWDFYRIDGEHSHDMFEEIASFYINYDAQRAEYMVDVVREYEAMLTPVEDIVWQRLIEG